MMSRTKRYPKQVSPEAPCECSWCNPAKANSDMRKYRKLRKKLQIRRILKQSECNKDKYDPIQINWISDFLYGKQEGENND